MPSTHSPGCAPHRTRPATGASTRAGARNGTTKASARPDNLAHAYFVRVADTSADGSDARGAPRGIAQALERRERLSRRVSTTPQLPRASRTIANSAAYRASTAGCNAAASRPGIVLHGTPLAVSSDSMLDALWRRPHLREAPSNSDKTMAEAEERWAPHTHFDNTLVAASLTAESCHELISPRSRPVQLSAKSYRANTAYGRAVGTPHDARALAPWRAPQLRSGCST